MNVSVHFRGPCSVQTTGVAHLVGLPNPLHSRLPAPHFMFNRVKKINQCQCLFPFEANKVHTVWPCPTEHHFVPSHGRPSTDPPAVPLVKVKGAFGVLQRLAFRIALSSALLDLFSDIWPLGCKTLALSSWNVTGASCQLTDTSAWQGWFYFCVLQGRKCRAVALMQPNCQLASMASQHWFGVNAKYILKKTV